MISFLSREPRAVTLRLLECYLFFVDEASVGTINLDRLDFVMEPYALGDYRLSRILIRNPENRCKGYGTLLLKRLCEDADEQRVALCCEASPYDKTSGNRERLITFYKKAGFEAPQPATPSVLRRTPR